MGVHAGKKMLVKGFLFSVTPLVLLTGRKLLAREISRLRFAPLEMTGRRDAIVFLTDRKLSFTLNSQVVNNYGVNQCDLFFPQCL